MPMNTNNILTFELNSKTPKKVIFDIIGFTEFGNRNGIYFDMEDLMMGPSKTPVKLTHDGDVIPNTYLVDRGLKDTPQGKVMFGQIISTDKEFIKMSEQITGFSIEGQPYDNKSYFTNSDGEAIIKKGKFDFQYIAALIGELPGSAGTEILNKKFEFRKNVGSNDTPKHTNSNFMNDEQLKSLQDTITSTVKEQVSLTFSQIKQEEAEANKVTFSFDKKETPENIADAIKKTFGYEFSLKENDLVTKSEDAVDVAFSQTEPVKAGNVAEKTPEPAKTFTFSITPTIN